MFEGFGEHSERQRFRHCGRLFRSGAVGPHAGKLGHLGEPAPVLFAFESMVRFIGAYSFRARPR